MPIVNRITNIVRRRRAAGSEAGAAGSSAAGSSRPEGSSQPAGASQSDGSPVAHAPDAARIDVELTIPRSRLESFAAILVGGHHAGEALSPSGLTTAFADAIARAGGSGAASVSRSPAALYTPEYWCFRIEAADERAHAVLAEAARREREA